MTTDPPRAPGGPACVGGAGHDWAPEAEARDAPHDGAEWHTACRACGTRRARIEGSSAPDFPDGTYYLAGGLDDAPEELLAGFEL